MIPTHFHDQKESNQSGVLRWFDRTRGYGFIEYGAEPADVLLHVNVLRDFGISSVSAGATIEYLAEVTPRGIRVAKVLSISDPPECSVGIELQSRGSWISELEPVKVRWFNSAAGYGFVNRFNSSDDIFIGQKVMSRAGVTELFPDEALSVRIAGEGKDARVYEIGSW